MSLFALKENEVPEDFLDDDGFYTDHLIDNSDDDDEIEIEFDDDWDEDEEEFLS